MQIAFCFEYTLLCSDQWRRALRWNSWWNHLLKCQRRVCVITMWHVADIDVVVVDFVVVVRRSVVVRLQCDTSHQFTILSTPHPHNLSFYCYSSHYLQTIYFIFQQDLKKALIRKLKSSGKRWHWGGRPRRNCSRSRDVRRYRVCAWHRHKPTAWLSSIITPLTVIRHIIAAEGV